MQACGYAVAQTPMLAVWPPGRCAAGPHLGSLGGTPRPPSIHGSSIAQSPTRASVAPGEPSGGVLPAGFAKVLSLTRLQWNDGPGAKLRDGGWEQVSLPLLPTVEPEDKGEDHS